MKTLHILSITINTDFHVFVVFELFNYDIHGNIRYIHNSLIVMIYSK